MSESGYIRFRGLTIEPGRVVPYAAVALWEIAEICHITGWDARFDADAQEVTFEEAEK